MKRTLLIAGALMLGFSAWASRAGKGIITLSQPDGTSIQARLHGDEYYNYFTTLDGRPLLMQADGSVVLSSWEEVHQQAWSTSQHMRKAMGGLGAQNANSLYFPHQGNPKVCVILMEFPDKSFTYSKDEIEQWLNGDQTQFSSTTKSIGSVAGYFDFSSAGQYRPQFEVYGPYMAPEESSYYGYNKRSATSLVKDALQIADADIDYSQYDNYGDDGCLDLVYVVFAGEGSNTSGDKDNQPWASAGMYSGLGTFDDTKACCWGVSAEIITNGDNVYQSGIGVFCHEMSHTMGLPDLYNMSLANLDNSGPEAWDLMDDGENLVNGMWPMPYAAWERYFFGWIDLEELNAPQEVVLYPLNDAEGRGKAYKVVNPADANEFYTLENIPTDSWYSWVSRYKGHGGMIMMHVNYDLSTMTMSSRPNATEGAPNLTVSPADGYLLSSMSRGKDRELDGEMVNVTTSVYREQLDGDPYPGLKEVHAVEYYHNYAGEEDMANSLPITDIVQHEDGSVSFKFMGGNEESIANVVQDIPANLQVYDLNGCLMGRTAEGLPHGLYLINGRKIAK